MSYFKILIPCFFPLQNAYLFIDFLPGLHFNFARVKKDNWFTYTCIVPRIYQNSLVISICPHHFTIVSLLSHSPYFLISTTNNEQWKYIHFKKNLTEKSYFSIIFIFIYFNCKITILLSFHIKYP